MAVSIAQRQRNPKRMPISFGMRAVRAFDALIDGQLIDEAGQTVARTLIRGDLQERRVLERNYERSRQALYLAQQEPTAATLAQLQALLAAKTRDEEALLLYDRTENEHHGDNAGWWDDSRDNRREACAILDGLKSVDPAVSEPGQRVAAEQGNYCADYTAQGKE